MTVPNPFIEFAQDPVAALGWLGYALLVLTLAVWGAVYALRQGARCVNLADRNHRQKDWWGAAFDGWLPPWPWVARAASVTLALAFTAWAIGSVLWLVGV